MFWDVLGYIVRFMRHIEKGIVCENHIIIVYNYVLIWYHLHILDQSQWYQSLVQVEGEGTFTWKAGKNLVGPWHMPIPETHFESSALQIKHGFMFFFNYWLLYWLYKYTKYLVTVLSACYCVHKYIHHAVSSSHDRIARTDGSTRANGSITDSQLQGVRLWASPKRQKKPRKNRWNNNQTILWWEFVGYGGCKQVLFVKVKALWIGMLANHEKPTFGLLGYQIHVYITPHGIPLYCTA